LEIVRYSKRKAGIPVLEALNESEGSNVWRTKIGGGR
jgi:hypothetical protein